MITTIDRTPWRCKRCGQLKSEAVSDDCNGQEHEWVAKVGDIDSLPYTPEDFQKIRGYCMKPLDTFVERGKKQA